MGEKILKLKKRNYRIYDLIGLAFSVAPLWTTLMLILRLSASLIPALSILMTANFLDTALTMLNGNHSPNKLVISLLGLCLIVAFQWMIHDVAKFIRSWILIATRKNYLIEIIEKQARLDYRYIEDEQTYDLIKRVTDPAETQISNQLHATFSLLDLLIQTISLLTIIFVNSWGAAFLILLFSIPTFYFGLKSGKTMYDTNRDLSKIKRQAQYLTEICTGREAVLERSLFGYGSHIIPKLWERFEIVRVHNQMAQRKMETQIGLSGILLSLTSGIIMLTLLHPVANGIISLGLFMSLTVACIELIDVLTNTLPERMRDLTNNLEYLKDLTKFVALTETEGALAPPYHHDFYLRKLEFKNVSFSYPGSNKRILNNVSFQIESNKHYAFVGENGAGKTTIIKLLTGQYHNYDGEILLNDKELRKYSQAELKAIFSVAYQDFAKYQMTIKENITIGHQLLKNEIPIDEVIKDLELTDFIEKLPKGIHTPLGKIAEDGIEASGGQWQRIALARTLINPAPIKILDEPTAALDPLSESRLYEQFEKIMKNRTSIFISHRLASIKLSDEIIVFEKGQVTEIGTHQQLMNRNGTYTKMYKSQLEWYQSEMGEEENEKVTA
jgi:ABC-type multidrug transport system fused ATPase/permease subunit